MAGVLFTNVDLRRAEKSLRDLARPDLDELAETVGQLVETQTRTRVSDEKEAPDGTPWQAWSTGYAATRGAQHSLLVGEGNPGLMESVANYTSGDEIRVGTNLVYGAIHQFGGEDVGMPIPERPYLGLSDENAAEVEDLVIGWLEDML